MGTMTESIQPCGGGEGGMDERGERDFVFNKHQCTQGIRFPENGFVCFALPGDRA